MAGTVVADTLQAASTSTLVLKNGVANTPPTVQDSAGTQIGTFCRAWLALNGTGTIAIRASFNVNTVTDQGNGKYRVNFINAMPDANFSIVTNAGGADGTTCLPGASFDEAPAVGYGQIVTANSVFTPTDRAYVYAAFFR